MTFDADRMADWGLARRVGARVAAPGPALSPVDRARLREDFAEVVPEAESLVAEFTGLSPDGYASRPWVMSREEWLGANLRGFQTLLEPVAARLTDRRPGGAVAGTRRVVVGVEIGGLLGYVSRRVLGQYDLFLPPDDDGLLYFVAPNVVGVERRFGFRPRDFRLWLSLHEVAHRLQFGGVPWLRGHAMGLIRSYLAEMELDVGRLLASVRRAREEVRRGTVEVRGMGWVMLLMTPTQRRVFEDLQALMALLEGHGTFVMNEVARGRVSGAAAFDRGIRERRMRRGPERAFQKAIGFDVKARQYDVGERFVAGVVARVGMQGFNRVWAEPGNLPSLIEVSNPAAWLARVSAG